MDERTKEIIGSLQKETQDAYSAIESSKRSNANIIGKLTHNYEQKLGILSDKEGVLTYENDQLSKQLKDLQKTSSDIEAHVHEENQILRSQVKVMGALTTDKLQKVDQQKKNFQRELFVLSQSADYIEKEEDKYKTVMKDKLGKIHEFLKRVHEVLGATHKEPELAKILRDLDQIALNVGMVENGVNIQVARKRCGVTNDDLVAKQMRSARQELETVE